MNTTTLKHRQTSASSGSFTLPGEAGHEHLTLRLARKWGADTIRDSDGTELSPEIIESGYDIYSTLCLVRSVQSWARRNQDKLQQNFLMSQPVVASRSASTVDLLKGYFKDQFTINSKDAPKKWWQAFDRTTGREVPKSHWSYDRSTQRVEIKNTIPGHSYTVNFLAFRIWEEISMYNHLTNNWGDREHLAAVDPMQPATQKVLLEFLERWLSGHPHTRVVRFTSMFYNFSWFWGSDHAHQRDIYSDWGDYAMTVSPRALTLFEQRTGLKLVSEDFVNGGLYNSTHNPPSPRYRAYMDFLHGFVIDFGRRCIDLVHRAGKKAYVFYDDHWIGVEPNSPRFREFGFDGLIKCVFNAFEVRLCAHARGVKTHELRLHPYLFPTGLKGEPTFKDGGDPTLDAKNFWIDARRGILRARIDRIGLGGYLSLVEPFPDFQNYIARLADEFRLLKSFHEGDTPYTAPFKIAVLTAWGDLRSWVASGHFTKGLDYNEMLESLAGLPLDVEFLNFADLRRSGIPKSVKVILNCGRHGSAWSGGGEWKDPEITALLTRWVHAGGGLLGIKEPSAAPVPGCFFRLAQILGIDRDGGERLANGRWKFNVSSDPHFITTDLETAPDFGSDLEGLFTLGPETQVLLARGESPLLTTHQFGKGRSVYFSGHRFDASNTRLLHRALFWAAQKENEFPTWNTSNPHTECAYFPKRQKLVVVNNSAKPQKTSVMDSTGILHAISLKAHDIAVLDITPRSDLCP